VDFVPPRFTAAELAALGAPGVRALLPQADVARPELARGLAEAGTRVDAVVAYRTRAAAADPAALGELARGVDAVTFTSGSCVRGFLDLTAGGPVRFEPWPPGIALACIGPSTAAVARGRGLPVHVEAEEHTAAGLVAALERHFAEEILHAGV
jgi:uroporphyrinogen III methyltransferase/synthase